MWRTLLWLFDMATWICLVWAILIIWAEVRRLRAKQDFEKLPDNFSKLKK